MNYLTTKQTAESLLTWLFRVQIAETNKKQSHVNIFCHRSWISTVMEIPGWEIHAAAPSQFQESGLCPTTGHHRGVLLESSRDSTRFDGFIIYGLLSVIVIICVSATWSICCQPHDFVNKEKLNTGRKVCINNIQMNWMALKTYLKWLKQNV